MRVGVFKVGGVLKPSHSTSMKAAGKSEQHFHGHFKSLPFSWC